MNFRLVVRPQVDDDLLEAEAWYEQQDSGLGREFLREAVEAIDRLLVNPLIHHVRHRRRQVRWAYTRRFPYRIIFRVIDDTIIVYTVIHSARHDRRWKERLE